MPPPEQMYCAQQIKIPPDLPDILKQFTKSAIRTQPPDILAWSSAYFTALSNGDNLPVKKRLEASVSGLTPGLLDMVLMQFHGYEVVETKVLKKKWAEMGLPTEELNNILTLGRFNDTVDMMHFIAVGSSHLCEGNITEAMKVACKVLTKDPDGGANGIPFETFKKLYGFLAGIRGENAKSRVESVLEYLKEQASRQDGMVMPRNFINQQCPKLS